MVRGIVCGGNDNLPSETAMPRKLGVLIFPNFQILDAAGPIAAFEIAERYVPGSYDIRVMAVEPGLVASSSRAALAAEALADRPLDTRLVPGGAGPRGAIREPELVDWVRNASSRARRTASVCSGAFLLAEAGLLDGRRATTHW